MFQEYYIIAWLLVGFVVTMFIIRLSHKEMRDRVISRLILGMILGPFGIIIALLPRLKKKYTMKSLEKLNPYESRLKYLRLKEEFLRYKLDEEQKKREKL
jgi:uncharacterized membrane protein